MESREYTFREKYFKVTPEEKIGPGVYFQRVIIMWLTTKMILLPLIIIPSKLGSMFSLVMILAFVSHLIFYYSSYFLSIKRTYDFGGKIWIPKLIFFMAVISLLSIIFLGGENELSQGFIKLLGMYLFIISFPKTQEIKTPE